MSRTNERSVKREEGRRKSTSKQAFGRFIAALLVHLHVPATKLATAKESLFVCADKWVD